MYDELTNEETTKPTKETGNTNPRSKTSYSKPNKGEGWKSDAKYKWGGGPSEPIGNKKTNMLGYSSTFLTEVTVWDNVPTIKPAF